MNHNTSSSPRPDGVVVYCASSSNIDPVYLSTARKMGKLIAESGLTLVCGGGAGGMMATAIEGAIEAGGNAVGVLPRFMIEKAWNHRLLTRCIETETMHERKQTMASMSRAAIALPGGIGTLDELAEIMTWQQLSLFNGPVIIVNTDGYYDKLIEMFETMLANGFMRSGVIPATIVATPEEAINVINKA